jgi:hydrogenase-1 operon protein HyaF
VKRLADIGVRVEHVAAGARGGGVATAADELGIRVAAVSSELGSGVRVEPATVSGGLGNGIAVAADQLGIRVAAMSSELGSGVAAIACEIANLLDQLVADGEAGAIDLRSLPMTAADRQRLQEVLGSGEVQATIDADGRSSVRETGISGVWWTEHRDRHGEMLAEIIEVCDVPEILVVAHDELAAAGRRLRERIAEWGKK